MQCFLNIEKVVAVENQLCTADTKLLQTDFQKTNNC